MRNLVARSEVVRSLLAHFEELEHCFIVYNSIFGPAVLLLCIVSVMGTINTIALLPPGPTSFLVARSAVDMGISIVITGGKSIFIYCLDRFNCEHFVNFLKFGKPISNQILVLQLSELVIDTLE